jgi:hypothetical protein
LRLPVGHYLWFNSYGKGATDMPDRSWASEKLSDKRYIIEINRKHVSNTDLRKEKKGTGSY